MNQIKKFQTAPGALPAPNKGTYYGGYPVKKVKNDFVTTHDDETELPTQTVTFDDGTRGGYTVQTIKWPDGGKSVGEYGRRNGVDVFIDNYTEPDGVVRSDTVYNGVSKGDVGYENLQRQFNGEIEGPMSAGEKFLRYGSPIGWVATGIQKLVGKKKQGGYLRLQKQGGKLTEVWTPFN